MSEDSGSWDDEFEGAWRSFRARLAKRVQALGVGDSVQVEAMAEESGLGCAPYVQFLRLATPGILAEVSGNHWLAPEHRVSQDQAGQLVEIGWAAPRDVEELDPDHSNFTAAVDPDDVDWLVVMAVRSLREVFGVVHPAFVLVDGAGLEDESGEPDEEPELSRPTSREQLVDLVDQAMTSFLGHLPRKDDDGDIPVLTGESVVFVQVHPVLPCVDLYVEVVLGIEETSRALVEVNILNRSSAGLSYVLLDDRVIARRRISADPFVPEQLRDAVSSALSQIDQIAGDLVLRIGGHKFAGQAPSKPRRPRRPSTRTWIETLARLEEDEPGSVSPTLAAHIFEMNQKAILHQIAQQRRAGRVDLADLLCRALRVVVERDAEQRASA